MSVSKFEFQNLISLLRRSENDPEVRKFFGQRMAYIERDDYYGWLKFRPEGIEVVFNEAPWVVPVEQIADPKELYLIAFHLYRKGHEGYAGYSGQLPNDVALDDLEAEVLHKMGQPIERGGGSMSTVLKRPIARWFQYAVNGAFLRFQLDPNDRVEMATIQAPELKLR